MRFTRRDLLRSGAVAASAALLPGSRLARAAGDDRSLVVLFLRGGADMLNTVVPRGDEQNYLALRNDPVTGVDITLPRAGPELRLDGFFELHPALQPLMPLFRSGELAIVHAVGGTDDYSHFTAMDAMERAAPGTSHLVRDGWLHRALAVMHGLARLDGPALALHGVSLGGRRVEALAGIQPRTSMAIPELAEFVPGATFAEERFVALQEIYAASAHPLLATVAAAAFDARSELEQIAGQPPDASYAQGDPALNAALMDAARLIKNPALRTRIVTIDFGGWDHHSQLFSRLDTRCTALAAGLSEFWRDLGSETARTCVLVVTEFGRTAFANGNGGTDHGHGGVMFVLGGAVNGGRVLSRGDPSAPGTGLPTPSGHWPGLGPGELHVQPQSGQERDLKATTDFRDVFGDVLVRFLGLPLFPVESGVLRGYTPTYTDLF